MAEPLSLIDRIYEAAALPERWPSVLDAIGREVDAPAAVLLTRRDDAWIGSRMSPSFEESMTAYLKTDIPARSDTTRRLIAADHAGFITEHEIFTPVEWQAEPFYAEWCKPWGWDHGAATAIQVPNGDFIIYQFQRARGRPQFTRAELERLDSFRPHLARAGLMAARMRLERLRAAAEGLGLMGIPAAVLDQAGRVLAANALIENLKEQVRWLANDRIALVDPFADGMLRNALAGLFALGAPAVRSFPARVGEQAMVVHLIPTPGNARDIFGGGCGVLTITPITGPESPSAMLIRGLFDLTAAEARVAQALTEGLQLRQIAKRHGVSLETVRHQIKAVLSKTGTRRQAQVAALLAGLPKLPKGD
jgi:DNA-binding CsgD family transcriptional regulator